MSSDKVFTTDETLTAEVARELPVAELVASAHASDETSTSIAFLEITRRFEPLLRGTWQAHGRGEYTDFVHDVFARTFAALPRLRTAAAFPAFFRSIVQSVAADQWRKKRPDEAGVDPRTLEEIASDVDDALLTALIVRSYLEHLPDRERAVLQWDFIDGRSTDEIARRLRIQPGAVRTLKSRALEKLRAITARESLMIERLRKI